MRIRVDHADIVLPAEVFRGSLLIEGAKIATLDAASHTPADQTIDATGLHLLPGVIDDQVHFREPGLTHKEDLATGSRACAKGGVTTYFDMPNTSPMTTSVQRLHEKLELAHQKSRVHYGFFIGATPSNLAELKRAERTPGIKIFIGSSTGDLLVDDQSALERIFAETTLPICAHCEDETTIRANREKYAGTQNVADHSRIRDTPAARIATQRAVRLAIAHRHRFHVLHVSTAAEIDLIADHQNLITAEVCPHHLFFHTGDYERLGTLVQMNPSLKTQADNAGLWQALLAGKIQVIATDHAPHTVEEKQRPYPESPSGIPAVENSLALMLNEASGGRCSLSNVAHWMSEAPARVWDVVDKGRIEVGYDADLVLVDMQRTETIRDEQQLTKCRWSPWHGRRLTGWPVRTWVRGRQVFADGQVDDTVRGEEVRFNHARGGYWPQQRGAKAQ